MIRRRQQKGPQAHYLIMINRQAAHFGEDKVKLLATEIRKRGGFYTTMEADSPAGLLAKCKIACGLRGRQRIPAYMAGRGRVTAIVAAGGDSTVNLAAQLALATNLPLGILPLGFYNNIARSLCPAVDIDKAIKTIVARNYRPIDTLLAGGITVVGSISMGLLPELARLLNGKRPPRFGFRWASLANKAAATVEKRKLTIKVDTFRFDVSPRFLAINLLPYSVGLAFSPVSVPDDKIIEVIFDVGCSENELGKYISQVYKNKYIYGNEVRLFRGSVINIRSVQGRDLLIDGNLVRYDENELPIQLNEKQLKVFCR